MIRRCFVPKKHGLRNARRAMLADLRVEYESAEVAGWGEQDNELYWIEVELGPRRSVNVIARSRVAALELEQRIIEANRARLPAGIDLDLLPPHVAAIMRQMKR